MDQVLCDPDSDVKFDAIDDLWQLGRVDKPDPDADCSEKDESREALDELVITGGYAA